WNSEILKVQMTVPPTPTDNAFGTGRGFTIEERFGVRYHNHHIPRLLHKLGFSVQRPRKRLARADAEEQEIWIRQKFPAIKKKQKPVAAS
ncbi:MAG: winged helix-turn-helix domain-containing protein, partial [Deltaproteobacteria bacterium]|nr:winged helix-turn-helix domain-containing protein [Deltaproteobacteria bacterium]